MDGDEVGTAVGSGWMRPTSYHHLPNEGMRSDRRRPEPDPRVAPFHVAKMTARLQTASSSGKPILLRVDYDAGHGIGSTRSQQDREAADTYAFLLWQLKSSG